MSVEFTCPKRLRRIRSLLTGAWRDRSGATAVEFALVAAPFLMFVLGVLGIGLYFFTSNSLDRGVELAARQIRTGQAQKNSVTVGQFKNLVCSSAGSYIDCSKLSVIVQSATSWSGITPQSCVDTSNNMVGSTGATGDLISQYTGSAKTVVLVTLCYKWELAQLFSFLKLGSGTNGSGPAVLQSATTFRSEPYS
jgi:Flp pilus assembly protein TadG